MSNRLLTFMQSLNPLDGPDDPALYAWPYWPGSKGNKHESLLDAWAVTTGSTSISVQYGMFWDREAANIDREVARCLRTGATIAVFLSPPKPDRKRSWGHCEEWMRGHCKRVANQIDGRVDFGVVFGGLELQYDRTQTKESRGHNRKLDRYNWKVYKYAKKYFGDVEIRRHGHLASLPYAHGGPRHWTPPYAAVDGGSSTAWYDVGDERACFTQLQATLDYAAQHDAQAAGGSLALSIVGRYVPGLCPGVYTFGGGIGGVMQFPIDPYRVFRAGRFFRHPEYFPASKGYPNFRPVHSLVLWPGLFDVRMGDDEWWAICLEEFLRGVATDQRCDRAECAARLAEAWGKLGGVA